MKILTTIERALLRPGTKDRALLYRDLADAIERREGLLDFFNGEIQNTTIDNNRSRAWLLRIMRARFAGLEQSHESTYAVRSYTKLLVGLVPGSDLMQIAAIDATSKEDQQAAGFRRLADVILQKSEMVWEVLKKMAMPILSVPVTYLVAYPSAKMINAIYEQSPPEIWKGLNWLSLVLSNWILDYGLIAMAVLLVLGIALAFALPNVTGPVRVHLDNVPGLSLYREFVGADVAMSLASLLANKVDLMDALEVLRARSSRWVRWQISRVINSLVLGRSDDYVRAFGRGIFSKPMTARIATLTRTAPAFSDALIQIGTTGIGDVRARINASADVLSVLVIMFFALIATIVSLGQLSVTNDMDAEMQPSRIMARQARRAEAPTPPPARKGGN